MNYFFKVFSDEKAYNFADGVAVHWYTDNGTSAEKLTEIHQKYPNKFILATEASEG